MYRLSVCFCMLLISFLFSCTASNDDEEPISTNPDEKLIVLGKVNSKGGEISVDHFALIVQPDVFKRNESISIYRWEGAQPQLDNIVSDVYHIYGLPRTQTEQIKVHIRLRDSSATSCYVSFGTEVYVPSSNKLLFNNTLVKAYVVDGSIEVFIPEIHVEKSVQSMTDYLLSPVRIFAVSNYNQITTPDSEFTIVYPSNQFQEAECQATLLEMVQVDSILQRFNLTKYSEQKDKPFTLLLSSLINQEQSVFIPSIFSISDASIELGNNIIKNDTLLKTILSHEYMHLLQHSYSALPNALRVKTKPKYHWFDEAIAAYLEGLTSAKWYDNRFQPFKGFNAGIYDGNENEHGYGMAGYVELLDRFYGGSVISEIYTYLLDGNDLHLAIEKAIKDKPVTLNWLQIEIYYDFDAFWSKFIFTYLDFDRGLSNDFAFLSRKLYSQDLFERCPIIKVNDQNKSSRFLDNYHVYNYSVIPYIIDLNSLETNKEFEFIMRHSNDLNMTLFIVKGQEPQLSLSAPFPMVQCSSIDNNANYSSFSTEFDRIDYTTFLIILVKSSWKENEISRDITIDNYYFPLFYEEEINEILTKMIPQLNIPSNLQIIQNTYRSQGMLRTKLDTTISTKNSQNQDSIAIISESIYFIVSRRPGDFCDYAINDLWKYQNINVKGSVDSVCTDGIDTELIIPCFNFTFIINHRVTPFNKSYYKPLWDDYELLEIVKSIIIQHDYIPLY